MAITFTAEKVTIEGWGMNNFQVTAEVEGFAIAQELSIADRLHGLGADEIVRQMGIEHLLDAIDADVIREYLKRNP